MIDRILEQKEVANRVLRATRKSESLTLTWQSIHVLESVKKALAPVSVLADALAGMQSTKIGPRIWPAQ